MGKILTPVVRRIRAQISAKLGRCPKCMRSSIVGSTAAWVTFLLTYLMSPTPLLLNLVLAVAIGFTTLMISHLVAFTIRTRHRLRSVVSLACCSDEASKGSNVEETLNMTRREFFSLSLKMGLGAFLFAIVPRVAYGVDTCTGASQTWPAGTTTAKFKLCEDCQNIRTNLQKTAAGNLEFCKQKSGVFCRNQTCDPTPGACDVRTATPLPRPNKGTAEVFVHCKQTKEVCDPRTKQTFAEVELIVKFAGMRCDCGCA